MINIEISIKSDRKDVKRFLDELKSILLAKNFNVDKDLIIIKSSKEEMQYSTRFTLVDLEYDNLDVVKRLTELTIKEYSETLLDQDNDQPPLLFVFGKDISGKLIYIKLKIKGDVKKKVLCVSFHYAKWKMKFPYA